MALTAGCRCFFAAFALLSGVSLERMYPPRLGVSRKRRNKSGTFARLALCVGFVCIANVPDLVRWMELKRNATAGYVKNNSYRISFHSLPRLLAFI